MSSAVNLKDIYPTYKAEVLDYEPVDTSTGAQYGADEYDNAGPSNEQVFAAGVVSHPEVPEVTLRAAMREVGTWPVASEVELQLPQR